MKKVEYERAKVLGRAYYRSHKCRKGECSHVTTTSIMTEGGWYPIGISICHAGLRAHNLADKGLDSEIVATIDLVPKLLVERGVAVSYFNWLFNKSPFRSVFMNRSAKSAFDHGVICRAMSNANLLVAGLMSMRLATEDMGGDRLGLWYKLVSMGCDPSLASIIVSYSKVRDGSVEVSSGSNHTVFGGVRPTKDAVLGFINCEPNKYRSFRDNKGYHGIQDVWEKGGGGVFLSDLLTNIRPAHHVFKDTPFGKKRFDVNSVDNWCEQAIELSEEFIK